MARVVALNCGARRGEAGIPDRFWAAGVWRAAGDPVEPCEMAGFGPLAGRTDCGLNFSCAGAVCAGLNPVFMERFAAAASGARSVDCEKWRSGRGLV